MVNNLLQGKWGGAGREVGRFLINSTVGIGGLFDPAKDYWGIPKSSEDFGQTLGRVGQWPRAVPGLAVHGADDRPGRRRQAGR